jgi:hypothetical protein
LEGHNSLADVFRFMQLRPPGPVEDVEGVRLLDTRFAMELGAIADVARRISEANLALDDQEGTVRDVGGLYLGDQFLAALIATRGQEQATTTDLLGAIGDPGALAGLPEFAGDHWRLSNTLVAATYGTRGAELDLPVLQDVFRVYALVAYAAVGQAAEAPLAAYLRRRLVAPASLARFPAGEADVPAGGEPRGRARAETWPVTGVAPGDGSPVAPAKAIAIHELARLDHGANVVQPTPAGLAPAGNPPFTLTSAARARLSQATLNTLEEHGINLDVTPVHAAVMLLADAATPNGAVAPARALAPASAAQPGAQPLPFAPPLIRPAGVAGLLVVKQQIKRYERGEIAHVENVLAGEKRSRTHRQLERTEETFTTETETTREKQSELETSERFELNRETSKTIEQDLHVGGGLTLSGRYGPSVEFSSNLEMTHDQSVEESTKNAATYSKQVVQRSLERIAERVREERVRRIIRETEEVNLHELTNDSAEHRSGIYQFLDKVYEAQVFDYGIREMFDFMVPEPASFLWYVDKTPHAGPRLPDPPTPIEDVAPDAGFINELNYRAIAARYAATDVESPPPPYQTAIGTFEHGDDGADEEGHPRSRGKIELTVPDGYMPWYVTVDGLALTDEDPVIGVTVAGRALTWQPGPGDRVDLGDGFALAFQPQLYAQFTSQALDPTPDSKLAVNVVAFETNTYSINATLVVRRTAGRLEQWQLATYAKIRAAFEARLQEYKETVAELTAQAEAQARAAQAATPFGQAPSQNRETIRRELKKHCITILTRQTYDDFDATKDGAPGAPPYFDVDEAAREGAVIRFFEQAFEWDQLQYVFYPYFWARKDTWIERFTRQDTDPEFRDFWQAGAARVVVPARPGFEVALTHFLETGKLWNGEGNPPDISSPMYVSIIDEIKQRTGAGQDEIPVGEPWDVRVPTPLLLVRPQADLPTWQRVNPDGWQWYPVGDGDAGTAGAGGID